MDVTQIVPQPKTIIDRCLDMVENDPYCDFQSEHCTPCVKTVNFEPNDRIALPQDINLIYGVQHHYGQPLICTIICAEQKINKFRISTDEIVWVLNGTPIINVCMQYQEVTMYFTTEDNANDNIYIDTLDFYGAMFDDLINTSLSNSFIQCVVDNYNCFRALSGLGGMYSLDIDAHTDTPRNIEELTRTPYNGSIVVFVYRNPINTATYTVLK